MSLSPMPPSLGSHAGDQVPTIAEPKPPALHWALLLLIDVATAGIFGIFWCFVQANFARKIDSDSKATLWFGWWLLAGLCVIATRVILGPGPIGQDEGLLYGVIWIAAFAFYQMGNFSIKKSLERYYASSGREWTLSSRMMVIFGQVYLQYHFSLVRKLTGIEGSA